MHGFYFGLVGKGIMACTRAVELIVTGHLEKQLRYLEQFACPVSLYGEYIYTSGDWVLDDLISEIIHSS